MKIRINRFAFIFILISMVLIYQGCKKDDNPVNDPSGSEQQNQNPTISSVICDPDTIFLGGTATITVTASDPDGDSLNYAYTATGGTVSGNGNTAIFTAGNTPGEATVSVTVSDDQGAEAQKTVSLLIEEQTVTRLYLRRDSLSIYPQTESGVTQVFIYSSTEWTATLAGDMVGTECTFGILMAVPPNASMVAKAEIIVKHGSQETILADETWTISSSTYERYVKTKSCTDPQSSAGDQLIVRITKVSNGSQGLGVIANTAEPGDSYVDVPFVELQ